MALREPIQVGFSDGGGPARQPILLLHPFLCSQNVWRTVAGQLADTGRFEVCAPTMLGHHGGHRSPTWLLDTGALVDDVERRMDLLGWQTAHIVGNSLGGWVAFELERRGRARTLTAIAPAGGWSQHSMAKYETVLKFILGGPALIAARLIGPRILNLPFARRVATLPISGPADGPSDDDLRDLVEDATHCHAYLQLLVKTLRMPGLLELAGLGAPTQLVVCERDRVFPAPRGHRYFLKHLPSTVEMLELEGLGHIPMLEAPARVADVIIDFIDRNTAPRESAIG
ncbi:alpha/beta hydrolase [Mycolicibacterium cyprinidarum]|nr:alpha/beta hydrolase [Mycolicibacterium sp. NGTWS1803]